MKIYTQKSELAQWVRTKLGEPTIQVPLPSEQLDDIIDDTVQYFGYHAGGIGNEEQYLLIDVCEDRDSDADSNGSLVDLEEGNCNPYDVASASGSGAYKRYKAEYQLPRNVEAIMQEFPGSSNAIAGDAQLLTYGAVSAAVGAVGALGGFGSGYYMGSSFGSRGGSRNNSGGYGIDIVSFEIGMEYLEMWRQRYSIKLRAQFLEQTRKVRFSPMPTGSIGGNGTIMIGVWAKVADKWLYEHIWVKNYCLALSLLQVSSNLSLFGNMSYPGGVTLNYEAYEKKGTELKEKLEKELESFKYNYPPEFLVG